MSRIEIKKCSGVVIDVQEFFLRDLASAKRSGIEAGTRNLVTLLSYLKIPVTFTIERPIEMKGKVPEDLLKNLSVDVKTKTLEKDFFDLTAEKEIVKYLRSLRRKQVILAGCETDVCVLQSCLGLIDHGYEVFVIEDLLFSSSSEVESARERMKEAGAHFLTFKTLFHDLLRAVRGSPHRQKLEKTFGPLPKSLTHF